MEPLVKYGYLIIGNPPVVSKQFRLTAGEAFEEANKIAGDSKIIIIENRSEETRRFLESKGLTTEWLTR